MAETKKTDWKAVHKDELTTFVSNFYRTSYSWRESSGYHAKWDKWERNANAIYDPAIKAQKKPWQACMFDPTLTPTNVELTTNALTKVLSGKEKPLGLKPREMGDELQAELHSCILDYEVQRSNFVVADYDVKKEACIYGSGFMKLYWRKQMAPRRVLKEVREGIVEAAIKLRTPRVVGYKEEVEEVIIKNDPVCEKVHIRDVFLEPNSTGMDRVLHRNKNLTYGELLNLSKQKNANGQPMVDPDSVRELAFLKESDKFDSDLTTSQTDKGNDDPPLVRPDYDGKRTVWEYWGPLPRKWVDLEMPEDTDKQREEANAIVPGKALVASGKYFLASEVNPLQSMEPPFVQTDYIRTNGRYGIGVAGLLEGIQDEGNEIRNLRADNVNLSMNKMFGVIEKYLVDVADAVSSPGGVWRFKPNTEDIRKVFMELQVSDVAIAAYRETGDLERKAQETVGNNRVTLGTAGQTKDTNQTLGGMELLRQSAFERFTMYAYIIGCTANIKTAKKLMELSYQNRDVESLKRILGYQPIEILPGEIIPKWAAYKRLPPHELELDYDFIFVDVFKAENKSQKLAAVSNFGQFLASVFPQIDLKPVAEEMARLNDFSPELIHRILAGIESGPMPTPMGMGQGVPSLTKPTRSFSGGEAAPMATSGAPSGPGQ